MFYYCFCQVGFIRKSRYLTLLMGKVTYTDILINLKKVSKINTMGMKVYFTLEKIELIPSLQKTAY